MIEGYEFYSQTLLKSISERINRESHRLNTPPNCPRISCRIIALWGVWSCSCKTLSPFPIFHWPFLRYSAFPLLLYTWSRAMQGPFWGFYFRPLDSLIYVTWCRWSFFPSWTSDLFTAAVRQPSRHCCWVPPATTLSDRDLFKGTSLPTWPCCFQFIFGGFGTAWWFLD